MRKLTASLLGLSIFALSASALAQQQPQQPQPTDPNATGGSMGGTATGQVNTGGTSTSTTNWTNTTNTSTTGAAHANTPDADRDHEKMSGHLGVMFHGLSNIPLADVTASATGFSMKAGSVVAPVVGVRYWLNSQMGIDAGLGFGWSGGSSESINGGVTTTTDKQSKLGFALHGGVPLALAGGKHYTFEVIPEMNFGIATSTIKGQVGAGGAAAPDTNLSGMRFDLGARAGAEIQFGFMGVPELALQASVGLYFSYQRMKASQTVNGADASVSDSSTSIATTVFSAPWALFTNNISAIYYF